MCRNFIVFKSENFQVLAAFPCRHCEVLHISFVRMQFRGNPLSKELMLKLNTSVILSPAKD